MKKYQKIVAVIIFVLAFLGSSYLEKEIQKVDDITRVNYEAQKQKNMNGKYYWNI